MLLSGSVFSLCNEMAFFVNHSFIVLNFQKHGVFWLLFLFLTCSGVAQRSGTCPCKLRLAPRPDLFSFSASHACAACDLAVAGSRALYIPESGLLHSLHRPLSVASVWYSY